MFSVWDALRPGAASDPVFQSSDYAATAVASNAASSSCVVRISCAYVGPSMSSAACIASPVPNFSKLDFVMKGGEVIGASDSPLQFSYTADHEQARRLDCYGFSSAAIVSAALRIAVA